MISLIPAVKNLKFGEGFLLKTAIFFDLTKYSKRLIKTLQKLPISSDGAMLHITFGEGDGEGYTLTITDCNINITADSERGAFYAIQTLRQIFENEKVPCLTITDSPSLKYRGFYHDVTRGKVPTVDTVKELIDVMSYYKMNALQLYVEHVFEFDECKCLNPKTSFLTAEELREIDEYCRENFIDFQPSLSTFGHMFEILQQEKYQHLRVLKNFEEDICRWKDRMSHHTINPSMPESFELVKSLIDQYAPNFTSKFFNICCDETFDLSHAFSEEIGIKYYVDFTKKIIEHVQRKGKTPMMWADMLLQHPQYIKELPDNIYFLNWDYSAEPKEETVATFAKLGRKQIVCPGTTTWNRFCEHVDREEQNIILLAEYGYKHGAIGMLITNWGDWGNPASLETSYYGLVLGAAKSWAIYTKATEEFYRDVNSLLYGNKNGLKYLRQMSDLHNEVDWISIMLAAHKQRAGLPYNAPIKLETVKKAQKVYRRLSTDILSEKWKTNEIKEEMLLSIEGICVLAELGAKLAGFDVERVTNTNAFLSRFQAKWLSKNKPSELSIIEDIFLS